jgi:hypothetical protein
LAMLIGLAIVQVKAVLPLCPEASVAVTFTV